MKGITVTKIVKEIKFEGVLGKIKSKIGLLRYSVRKYLRLTQDSPEIAHYGSAL